MRKLKALVRLTEGVPEEVVAVGPWELLLPVAALEEKEMPEADELLRLAVRDVRVPRPVVVVSRGMVVEALPGFGVPLVLDLDEEEVEEFAVRVDGVGVLLATRDWAEALEAARKAVAEGAWLVDLELRDGEGELLSAHTLYEAHRPWLEEEAPGVG